MTARTFVDTNVLVYVYDSSQATKQGVAADWLDRLWREQTGRTSVQVLNELYVTLSRKLARRMDPDEAWDIVQALTAWDPQPVDRSLLLKGREIERRYRISWWDSLIVAAASLQDCDTLLSEDLQHGMVFDNVRVRNPFTLMVQEGVPVALASREGISPRHRPRGRPRKKSSAIA